MINKSYIQRFAYEWDQMKAWVSEQESKDEAYVSDRKREQEITKQILGSVDDQYLEEVEDLLRQLESLHVDELVLEGQLIFSYAIAWLMAKKPENDPEISSIIAYIQAKE
jgi:hypothetical protein